MIKIPGAGLRFNCSASQRNNFSLRFNAMTNALNLVAFFLLHSSWSSSWRIPVWCTCVCCSPDQDTSTGPCSPCWSGPRPRHLWKQPYFSLSTRSFRPAVRHTSTERILGSFSARNYLVRQVSGGSNCTDLWHPTKPLNVRKEDCTTPLAKRSIVSCPMLTQQWHGIDQSDLWWPPRNR